MEARADASLRSPTAMVMTLAIPATQEVDLFEYRSIARGGRPGFLGGRDLTGPADPATSSAPSQLGASASFATKRHHRAESGARYPPLCAVSEMG